MKTAEQINMPQTGALTVREPQPLAPIQDAPTPGQMLAAILEKGVTAENVTAIERMAALYERMEERKAEREFNAAFAALQSEMPQIVAETVIPNRGKYQRFEDVLRDIGPKLAKHGFSLSFEQMADDKRVTVTCTLRHAGGHSTRTPFSVRVSGKADNATQDDCKASTTAKRNSMLQALNIVIRQDCLQDEEDPRNEGGEITHQQAMELHRRVQETNSNEMAFLKYCGAKQISNPPCLADYKTIPESGYHSGDEMLQRKEQRGR